MNKRLLACWDNIHVRKSLLQWIKLGGFFCHFSVSVINCTSLTIDPAGPLRMSSCDNHYGAQCNFSCTIGYRLNGSSTVTCVAPRNQYPGEWNNKIPTCGGKLENVTTFNWVKTKMVWRKFTQHNYTDAFIWWLASNRCFTWREIIIQAVIIIKWMQWFFKHFYHCLNITSHCSDHVPSVDFTVQWYKTWMSRQCNNVLWYTVSVLV